MKKCKCCENNIFVEAHGSTQEIEITIRRPTAQAAVVSATMLKVGENWFHSAVVMNVQSAKDLIRDLWDAIDTLNMGEESK